MYHPLKDSVMRFGAALDKEFEKNKFVILLCGPNLNDLTKPGAQLRKDIKEILEKEGFEVVLGEDEGLENIRSDYSGYAHTNELLYIEDQCNAVVIIASSVGSFCELGLFSHFKVQNQSSPIDMILIAGENHKDKPSYFCEGPAKAIEDFGAVYYTDFQNFDPAQLVGRLRRRRHVHVTKGSKK